MLYVLTVVCLHRIILALNEFENYDLLRLTNGGIIGPLWYNQKRKFNRICQKIAKFGHFFELQNLQKMSIPYTVILTISIKSHFIPLNFLKDSTYTYWPLQIIPCTRIPCVTLEKVPIYEIHSTNSLIIQLFNVTDQNSSFTVIYHKK